MIDKYQMPLTEHYRYAQIYHFVQTLARKGDLAGSTPTEYLCSHYDNIIGHITAIYPILMNVSTKLNYMIQWEKDSEESIDLG